MQIGYCCNVHPGTNLGEVQESLLKYSSAVKQQVSPDHPLPVGLWISATAAQELDDDRRCQDFRRFLEANELMPYTLNGFPFGDFHQPVVQYEVYKPTWADPSRLDYTLQLVQILDALLPRGAFGTISTLPLGWPVGHGSEANFFLKCAEHLNHLVQRLAELEESTGRRIIACLEPEPGCVLDSADDVAALFEDYLDSESVAGREQVRRYLGVCHDVCHSAVMFESQKKAVEIYRQSGISLAKVQISSSVELDFDHLTISQQKAALNELGAFAEPKYLHQTVWQHHGKLHFFANLDQALLAIRQRQTSLMNTPQILSGKLRVHFHVPVFADRLGLLSTTQTDIQEFLTVAREANLNSIHFEVETYAWNVLPIQWQPGSLADGIAREIKWLSANLSEG